MAHHFAHDRAEACNRSRAQVITVAEAARENDHIRSLKIVILVPQVRRLLAEDIGDGLKRVVVAVGAGERHDSELHACTADSMSKSSVTGFASNFWHISMTASSAAIAS